jgi:hypothetical protein
MKTMTQKKNYKERPIGKNPPAKKKHLIDPRYKNTFWTGVVIIILIIFFIINNTRETPASGTYPPEFNPVSVERLSEPVPPAVRIEN